MDDLLRSSKAIIDEAIADYQPYAVVAMVSGGDDSLTALTVARLLNVKIDFILHGITGTGVRSTTEHVRQVAMAADGIGYIEADAGDAYEKYVLRKGFYGVGHLAHSYTYHICKKQHFRAALSRHIRHGKRGRNILLISGARWKESKNRRQKLVKPINPDLSGKSNIWVDIIYDWSKRDCLSLLQEQNTPRCPAAIYCHRSGECMCGTMQRKEEAEEIAYWFPDWAEWWHGIRARVRAAGFTWDWGEDVPAIFKARKAREKALEAGQLDIFNDWLPMCHSCQERQD